MKINPKYGLIIGAYVLVDPDVPLDAITARAMKAGLHIALEEKNKPRATTGVIVALGNDPSLPEMGFEVGRRVSWSSLAGERELINGKEYRLLGFNEIRRILPPDQDPTKVSEESEAEPESNSVPPEEQLPH